MPLQLPNLDDRTYNDLVAEALTLIPAHSPEWTNYNPSDPGITLIELFAYLTELLVYRLNRVTDDSTRKFLQLLNGPDWIEPANADLREEIRQAILGIRERFRAVTSDDYEFLSTVTFNESIQSSSPGLVPAALVPISRAHCVPQRNLEAGTEADRLKLQPEHVSMVIVPATPVPGSTPNPQPPSQQLTALFDFLDERRMLTTKLHVIGPFYAPVSAELVIARTLDAADLDLIAAIDAALAAFLNPLPSDSGSGWPFGRDVFVSEIYDVLQNIEGVDFITDVFLKSSCTGGDAKCVAAEPIWHPEGNLVGLRLQQHHLPFFDRATIAIAPGVSFQTTNLSIATGTAAGADAALVKMGIQSTLRTMLSPGLKGPAPTAAQPTSIFLSDLQVAIKGVAGVIDPVTLVADCMPSTILQHDKDRGPYLYVVAGKVLDFRVQIQLS